MNQRKLLATVAGVVALAVGAGASTASAVGTAAKATTVKVALGTKSNEFALTPSVRSAAAGAVTFVVTNGGKLEHEFVVLKTKTPAGKLPTAGGKAKETGAVGEIGEFGSGQTKRLTLTLKPGHYALICNVAGHYMGGQRVDFTVK